VRESAFTFQSEPGITIAGTLCAPGDASSSSRVPAILLSAALGQILETVTSPRAQSALRERSKAGLQRRLAHALAESGIATARFDKRGCGESGGRADESDYETDRVDNVAAVRYLR
jgi:predicted acyl esterase